MGMAAPWFVAFVVRGQRRRRGRYLAWGVSPRIRCFGKFRALEGRQIFVGGYRAVTCFLDVPMTGMARLEGLRGEASATARSAARVTTLPASFVITQS